MTDTRIIDCDRCGGDGGWFTPYAIDRTYGGYHETWTRCEACNGSREMEIEVQPIEMEDLPPMHITPDAQRALLNAILAECSRRPHSRDGRGAVAIIQRIEALVTKARDDAARPHIGPARDGIEAQHALNDVFPGDRHG